MIGSIDCMKWEWALCPRAHAGQYKGREKKPTVVLEAIASGDLWIWHADFGTAGSNNDINVLQRSSFLRRLLHGEIPRVTYKLGKTERDLPFLLADGIYPNWSVFAKGIATPTSQKEKNYTKLHSALRKDVERAFGVLQRQWRILALPARFWTVKKLEEVMHCCIILHNMIVESRHDLLHVVNIDNEYEHIKLQKELVEHAWE
eukprot:jgi/Phyca11/49034/gw1.37.263.1